MVIFKCKYCGGDIIMHTPEEEKTCAACSKLNILPAYDNVDISSRCNLALHLCKEGAYEEAENVMSEVITMAPECAEVYWRRALCRYGILVGKDRKIDPQCDLTVPFDLDPDVIKTLELAQPKFQITYKLLIKDIKQACIRKHAYLVGEKLAWNKEHGKHTQKVLRSILTGFVIVVCVLTGITIWKNMSEVKEKQHYYVQASDKYKNGYYQEAAKLFEMARDFQDAEMRRIECLNKRAEKLYANGFYGDAIIAYSQIRDYANARKKEKTVIADPMYISNWMIGETVFFGQYEQDNNYGNGPELLQWIVLAKDDQKYLLLSRYLIDARAQSRSTAGTMTWENSQIRQWLNTTVYDMFSEEEKQYILLTDCENLHNSMYGKKDFPVTKDYLFLLSEQEVEHYLKRSDFRLSDPTVFCQKAGGTRWYWLRTQGASENSSMGISNNGVISYIGNLNDTSSASIRPAMWVQP